MRMKKKSLRIILSLTICVLLVTMFSATALAAGDVSGAIEGTWNAAKSQVQTVVNNVIFPVIDMILAILLFVTLTASMFDMAAFYTAFSVLAAVILLKAAAYWFYSRQGGERPL